MITLRLNEKLENEIENTSKSFGITKSEFIRRSILEYLQKSKKQTSWELGKNLFGQYSSSTKDLAKNSENIFKSKMRKSSK